jgi:hypothetical protein
MAAFFKQAGVALAFVGAIFGYSVIAALCVYVFGKTMGFL